MLILRADRPGGAVLDLMTEALASQEGQTNARGLPENDTYDSNALTPICEPSSISDLDMFTTSPVILKSGVLASTPRPCSLSTPCSA
jgi:hypothetical protein